MAVSIFISHLEKCSTEIVADGMPNNAYFIDFKGLCAKLNGVYYGIMLFHTSRGVK